MFLNLWRMNACNQQMKWSSSRNVNDSFFMRHNAKLSPLVHRNTAQEYLIFILYTPLPSSLFSPLLAINLQQMLHVFSPASIKAITRAVVAAHARRHQTVARAAHALEFEPRKRAICKSLLVSRVRSLAPGPRYARGRRQSDICNRPSERRITARCVGRQGVLSNSLMPSSQSRMSHARRRCSNRPKEGLCSAEMNGISYSEAN